MHIAQHDALYTVYRVVSSSPMNNNNNNNNNKVRAIQGHSSHRFWYQSKATANACDIVTCHVPTQHFE